MAWPTGPGPRRCQRRYPALAAAGRMWLSRGSVLSREYFPSSFYFGGHIGAADVMLTQTLLPPCPFPWPHCSHVRILRLLMKLWIATGKTYGAPPTYDVHCAPVEWWFVVDGKYWTHPFHSSANWLIREACCLLYVMSSTILWEILISDISIHIRLWDFYAGFNRCCYRFCSCNKYILCLMAELWHSVLWHCWLDIRKRASGL